MMCKTHYTYHQWKLLFVLTMKINCLHVTTAYNIGTVIFGVIAQVRE